MIKGLDDDEVEFLDLVDKNKMNAERKAQLEEAKEMNEFRQKVASLQGKRMDEVGSGVWVSRRPLLRFCLFPFIANSTADVQTEAS